VDDEHVVAFVKQSTGQTSTQSCAYLMQSSVTISHLGCADLEEARYRTDDAGDMTRHYRVPTGDPLPACAGASWR
jgi:hypothetical protein